MTQTYFRTACIGLDDFFAGVLLNRNDLTISGACGLVRRGFRWERPLALHRWQIVMLRAIGAALEFIRPGHCEGAIANDIKRAQSTLALLEGSSA